MQFTIDKFYLFFREGVGFQPRVAQSFKENVNKNALKCKEIECVINGEESFKCRREAKEVYMPFSFIQRYFEVLEGKNWVSIYCI